MVEIKLETRVGINNYIITGLDIYAHLLEQQVLRIAVIYLGYESPEIKSSRFWHFYCTMLLFMLSIQFRVQGRKGKNMLHRTALCLSPDFFGWFTAECLNGFN